jgi:hypothetical protein
MSLKVLDPDGHHVRITPADSQIFEDIMFELRRVGQGPQPDSTSQLQLTPGYFLEYLSGLKSLPSAPPGTPARLGQVSAFKDRTITRKESDAGGAMMNKRWRLERRL